MPHDVTGYYRYTTGTYCHATIALTNDPRTSSHALAYVIMDIEHLSPINPPIEINIDGLSTTKQWLGTVYTELSTTSSDVSGNLSPNIVLSRAYLNLLDWPENHLFPEVCRAL